MMKSARRGCRSDRVRGGGGRSSMCRACRCFFERVIGGSGIVASKDQPVTFWGAIIIFWLLAAISAVAAVPMAVGVVSVALIPGVGELRSHDPWLWPQPPVDVSCFLGHHHGHRRVPDRSSRHRNFPKNRRRLRGPPHMARGRMVVHNVLPKSPRGADGQPDRSRPHGVPARLVGEALSERQRKTGTRSRRGKRFVTVRTPDGKPANKA